MNTDRKKVAVLDNAIICITMLILSLQINISIGAFPFTKRLFSQEIVFIDGLLILTLLFLIILFFARLIRLLRLCKYMLILVAILVLITIVASIVISIPDNLYYFLIIVLNMSKGIIPSLLMYFYLRAE